VRETVTSLTCELFCLDSRNNSARAPVNYDLKKHRTSRVRGHWACMPLSREKIQAKPTDSAVRRERRLIQFY